MTLGEVHLEGHDFSRPKPLLLLAYLAVEGPQDRHALANLFWKGDSKDKAAMRKKLVSLSVLLNKFKKEGIKGVVPEKAGVNPLPILIGCDALNFLKALEASELEKAIELYKAPFLHNLNKSWDNLDLPSELCDWVILKQEFFANKAREAMIKLAEQALVKNNLNDTRRFAERAQDLAGASEAEPELLSKLQSLLAVSHGDASVVFRQSKEILEELSSVALKVFLILSLQNSPHFGIARAALRISASELEAAREELILAGLIDVNMQLKAKDLAQDWLTKRPAEHTRLLLKLGKATPAEQAFPIYYQVFKRTQSFGGIGDMPTARQAFAMQAKALIDKTQFAEAAELLTDMRIVERALGIEPDPNLYFLEAYALERKGLYKQAIDLLQTMDESLYTPDVVALMSVLFWRCGKREEAEKAAEVASESGLEWLWAKATAMNTLGYIANAKEDFLEGASCFKKAASLYKAKEDKQRWVGALNNYAISLDKLAEKSDDAVSVERWSNDAEQAYQAALEALDELGDNPLLSTRILLNLGLLWERRQNWSKAESYYLQASKFAQEVNVHDMTARIQLNLGFVYSKQKRVKEAIHCFNKAIDVAHKAGEFLVQGQAMMHLADMNNDVDTMEVALDLIQQSGNIDRLKQLQKYYEGLLKHKLGQALTTTNNTRYVQMLLEKLERLYKIQKRTNLLIKVKDALKNIENSANLDSLRLDDLFDT